MHCSRVACSSWPQAGRLVIRRPPGARCMRSSAAVARASGNVLFLSPVWPERSSSAAGVRTADLIDGFREAGYSVSYSSPSKPNSHSELLGTQGVRTFQCAPNREEELAEVLRAVEPAVCVFDRFYAEEAFSFRVRELAPRALRVLDMQDVHFLRAGRQELAAQGAAMGDIMRWRPTAASGECLRELAAIHRSDLTLVCSPEEMRLLVGHYGVPQSKLVLAPFFTPPSPYAPAAAPAQHHHHQQEQQPEQQPERQPCPPWPARRHFMMIGNFRHPPNADSVEWAVAEVWPRIRAQLGPDPELHVYGSYAPGGAQRLHKPAAGVHFKGFAPSLDLMLGYRVMLAPLRFGAGLKGKVVDSWWHGLPVCTTPVGAEGMRGGPAGTAAGAAAAAGRGPEGHTAGSNAGSAGGGSSSSDSWGAAVDPAEEGYIWQMGGMQTSTASSVAQQSVPDPAAEGHPWQLGPPQPAADAAPAASAGKEPEAGWGGLWQAATAEELAADAVRLYSEEALWGACQRRGFQLLDELYDRQRNLAVVLAAVQDALAELEQRRSLDYTGQLLWQQQFRATEFMSRWIELKERGPRQGGA